MKIFALVSAVSAFHVESVTIRDVESGYYGNEDLGIKFSEKGDKNAGGEFSGGTAWFDSKLNGVQFTYGSTRVASRKGSEMGGRCDSFELGSKKIIKALISYDDKGVNSLQYMDNSGRLTTQWGQRRGTYAEVTGYASIGCHLIYMAGSAGDTITSLKFVWSC